MSLETWLMGLQQFHLNLSIIVASDHITLAILTYDSAILTPHTHNSKRLLWVFYHSHIPLLQSPGTILAWRLGFLCWALTVLDLLKQDDGLSSAWFLDLSACLIFDYHLPSEVASLCPIHARASKLRQCFIFADKWSRHINSEEYQKAFFHWETPHRWGQNGHLHSPLASISVFNYCLSCQNFSQLSGLQCPISNFSLSSLFQLPDFLVM